MLRGPIAGYTAEERATNSIQRIEQYLDADRGAEVTFEENDGSTRVMVGGKHAFLVTRIDIDQQATTVDDEFSYRLTGFTPR